MGRLSSVAGLALISHENHEASHRHSPVLRALPLEAAAAGIVVVVVGVVGSLEGAARERLLMRLNASVCLTFVGRWGGRCTLMIKFDRPFSVYDYHVNTAF